MTELLIVFGKADVPGEVKTRLVPPLTFGQAAELNRAFTLDTLVRQANASRDIRLCLSTPDGMFDRHADEFAKVPGGGVDIRPQQGDGLGERMKQAFGEAFSEGYDRVVILGSDHPSLPTDYVDSAFEHLTSGPAVAIGPALDGGYYLIGMDRLYPEAFKDMTYSHDRVYADTIDRLRETTARIVRLKPWYDVDDGKGLERLMNDLAEGVVHGLPRSRQVLDRLDTAIAAVGGKGGLT